MDFLTGLQGKTALVTAAGDDIGRAVALALAGAGARVAINACDPDAADRVAAEARRLGAVAATVAGDVSDVDAATSVADLAREQLGPIDILAHCVGIRPHSLVVDSPVDEWRKVMDTNCSSFFYLAQRLLPAMTARGFGRLVAVSVASDDRTRARHGSVAAARAALHELVKVVAVETGASGVTANIVSMAITETAKPALLAPEMLRSLVPVSRPGTLKEIASACLYLASKQGAYITGHTLHVDGGFTL
jgi:NAD(P)-dependent dehydrogenase (short-subunit alcohol dehydrogenase family)